mgnify:CR=1 FL=1
MKTKNCVYCGKTFSPQTHTNTITCSLVCRHQQKLIYKRSWYKKHARRIYLKYFDYRKKHYLGRQIALRLVKKLGITKRCAKCGSNNVIDIHHKDGNTSNNALNNLQILCRVCHLKAHRELDNNFVPTVQDMCA